MICDGTVRERSFFYFQKNKDYLERFIGIVKNVFGNYHTNPKRGHIVPLIFKNIISNYFDAYFFRSLTAKLPKKVFELPKLHKVAILTAALLDDGSSISCIAFYSASTDFIKNLKILAESLDYKCTKIIIRKPKHERKHNLYRFNISAESIRLFFLDLKELFRIYPKLHIMKKYEDIKQFIEIEDRGWSQRGKGESKRIILTTLKEGEKTSYELRDIVNINLWTTYHHLQYLVKKDKVTKYKKFKRKFVYKLV